MENDDHPPVLENRTPDLVVNLWNDATSFLEENGWYLLFGGIIAYLIWSKVQNFLDVWYEERERSLYAARCHKDPDWLKLRKDEESAARSRMQEKMDQKIREHQEKLKEKAERKREEEEGSLPSRLGGSKHRPEFHPLAGDSGGRYRAPKKSCCPGGSCG